MGERGAAVEVFLEGLTLHVNDIERSRDFYARIPGAELLRYEAGLFALFRFGDALLGLLRVGGIGFHVELATDDLDLLYETLVEAGIEPLGPPKVRPWGERTIELADPDGHRLQFDER